MKLFKIFLRSTILLTLSLFYSCETDFTEDGEGVAGEGKNFAVFVVTNTADSSGFLVPFDDLPTGEIDVNKNLEKGILLGNIRNAGVGFNGAVYHTSNPFGEPGIQKLVLDGSGRFITDGFIPTGSVSYGGGSTFGFR